MAAPLPSDRPNSFRRSRGLHLAVLLISFAAFAGFAYWLVLRTGKVSTQAAPVVRQPRSVGCLGRVVPDEEVIKLSAPVSPLGPSLIADLRVKEGDAVRAGQLIAVLDCRERLEAAWRAAQLRVQVAADRLAQVKAGAKAGDLSAQRAEVLRMQVEAENAERELKRAERLFATGDIAASDVDSKRMQAAAQAHLWRQAEERLKSLAEVRPVDVSLVESELQSARADADRAKAELNQAYVYSPLTGRVIKIHARPGENPSALGVVDLARTEAMSVIAEVYETDIGMVKVGQRAVITGSAVPHNLTGSVVQVGLHTTHSTLLNLDPASFADERVIEVRLRLDQGEAVAGLINARVNVQIFSEKQ